MKPAKDKTTKSLLETLYKLPESSIEFPEKFDFKKDYYEEKGESFGFIDENEKPSSPQNKS